MVIGKELNRIITILLIVTVLVVVFNTYQLSTMGGSSIVSIGGKESSNGIIPTGVPKIYGEELGISFDDVSPNDPYSADATIGVMKQLDKDITVEGDDLDRYINILYTLGKGISCEYCCGAQSVIFSDGRAACGCAHSYAMRGLAKYLVTEHGDDYTDEEIQAEVGKWKVLFFPTQMQEKADILKADGVDVNYNNVANNEYRGVEQGASGGGMVGGC